ncbi:hypothetical protein D769_15465 [Cupriavidus sp. HMR-1]|uniref:Z1 domain-containing protein n=1 Tax=Cupriavidus sp. HMR-1 TaxID=1249621 RepID=UPI0002A3590E|nr:Z1 domain-containing protein [Cupriavidus sp. HMR-1]EKZ98385.1 hypothetical protein D769_15465 [Cupriavidus sp. HMR-1]
MMSDLNEYIDVALGAMQRGPRKLKAYLEKPGPDMDVAGPLEVEKMIGLLLSPDPNDSTRLRFSNLLRSWDNEKDPSWAGGTERNTAARRKVIHERLASDLELQNRIDSLIPHFPLDEPIIISEKHQSWYKPEPGARDYYWSKYVRYLQENRNWGDESLLNLNNTTRSIVECLADPESLKAYASRGLVMGYVQSGKTANFMGVVARAADAGYRLIIVLAGTWNILRNQTQRRFDKELLGKEFLANDESYTQNPPADWSDFLEHGANPVDLGYFAWQRLTRPDIDFKRLKAAIDNLEFEKPDKSKALNAPGNLHTVPVKILIIKKNPVILKNLVKDLGLLRTKLIDIPTLIIDDESDQAGLNTVDPTKVKVGERGRSPTNEAIVDLLRLFPRGQYIGYTATPYANVLVDPDDFEDLFPKDFIVSLDRPSGYMGVSDFFDPTVSFDDLNPADYSQPEIAYIRRVNNPVGSDSEDLRKAIRSYVLAGGIKLFRHAVDPVRYKEGSFRHHTMLVHTSQLKGEHASLASTIEDLWDSCAFNSPKGQAALEKLWLEDFAIVSSKTGSELVPASFTDLVPYLSEAIKRIQKGQKPYLVLNSDSSDAPDFGAQSVWKIFIGGNKLSRGYTIEGLTVSYYRRVAGTGDTLMQMGRWFGFRAGYRDLVRVFLGVVEGRSGNVDLVSAFKEVCRMEEDFRGEISRYVRTPGKEPLTPKQIPPLISLFGNFPPTARNKMFNAMLEKKNFGGRRSMPTLISMESEGQKANVAAVKTLIESSKNLGSKSLGGLLNTGAKIASECVVFDQKSTNSIAGFLREFRWLEADYGASDRPADISLQIEFLEKEAHEIKSWLILAPQRKDSFGTPLKLGETLELTVKKRKQIGDRGFEVFGEPDHRVIANYLAGIVGESTEILTADPELSTLKAAHRGVLLLYPVRAAEADPQISVGFEIYFPPNNLPFQVGLTVRRKADFGSVVVN